MASCFIDNQNREWDLSLTVGTIEDVKDKIGIDLDDLIKHPAEFSSLLIAEPRKFVQLLYAICEEQAERNKVSPRDFGRMFDRQLLDKACDTLIEAIVNFYPRSAAGEPMRELLPRLLAKADAEMAQKTREYLNKELSN